MAHIEQDEAGKAQHQPVPLKTRGPATKETGEECRPEWHSPNSYRSQPTRDPLFREIHLGVAAN